MKNTRLSLQMSIVKNDGSLIEKSSDKEAKEMLT